jgi:broad specificity phosphatase PhoE
VIMPPFWLVKWWCRNALPLTKWYLKVGLFALLAPRTRRGFVKWLMEITDRTTGTGVESVEEKISTAPPDGHPKDKPARLLLLVRHGQTTFNVEGRLPGQLPGIALTDEGRRQAQSAAVALSGLPLSAVISSPLERAQDTAQIIARGWALPVRLDPRLKDTDVGAWSGQKLDDLGKTDPLWKAFVEHPDQPPAGVESFAAVQSRSVAVVEEILQDASVGQYIVLVAHADVVKLILGHYTGLTSERARFLVVGNASISALAFPPQGEPHLLALNWSALPEWLNPPARPRSKPESEGSTTSPEQAAESETPESSNDTPNKPAATATVPTPDGSLKESEVADV